MLKLYRADIAAKYQPDFYTNIVDRKFKGDIDRFVDDMFKNQSFPTGQNLMLSLKNPH